VVGEQWAVVEKLFEPVVLHANMGSFDFVRLCLTALGMTELREHHVALARRRYSVPPSSDKSTQRV
jgi:hypothetical protein